MTLIRLTVLSLLFIKITETAFLPISHVYAIQKISYFDEGRTAYQNKAFKKAFALFDQALSDVTLRNADTKMKADIWYWKGRAHQADLDTLSAGKSYRKTLRYYSSHSGARKYLSALADIQNWYTRASAAFEKRDWQAAHTNYKKITQFDQDFRDIKSQIADVQNHLRTQRILQKAKEFEEKKNYSNAMQTLQQVSAVDSVSAFEISTLRKQLLNKWLATAKNAERLQQWTLAESILKNITQVVPNDRQAKEILKRVQQQQVKSSAIVKAPEPVQVIQKIKKNSIVNKVKSLSAKNILPDSFLTKTPQMPQSDTNKINEFIAWLAIVVLLLLVLVAFLYYKKNSFKKSPEAVSDNKLSDNFLLPVGYDLIEKVGEGDFGDVYKAHEKILNRIVAIKRIAVPKNSSPDEIIMEAQTLAMLKHENIVRIHNANLEKDKNFVFMIFEFIDGPTLEQYLKDVKRLDFHEAVRITMEVYRALDYAHNKNIVHRDIKPSNIMLDDIGKAILVDFGLSKIIDETPNLYKTNSSVIKGTFRYMSPEQMNIETKATLDGRSDIFSLGLIFYELLTGEHPFARFANENFYSLPQAISTYAHPKISSAHSDISTNLDPIIDKMLAKDLGQRYQTAETVLQDLGSLI